MLSPRTVAEQCGITPAMLSALAMMVPGLGEVLDRALTIHVDDKKQRVLVRLGDKVLIDKTFEEVNEYGKNG